MKKVHFPALFDPGTIGKLRIRNRMVMLPMARQFQSIHGEVTQKTIDYYVERAKGGVGLIIAGSSDPFPPDHPVPHTAGRLSLGDAKFLPGHCELVQAVHAHGARIGIQLGHSGGQRTIAGMGGKQPISASGVQQLFCDGHAYDKPRPITRGEIYQVIDIFAAAAGRAKMAGYDLVEFHTAHDYLVGGFMSPLLNRRSDEFGGSLENRMRFAVEIVKRTRKVAGADFLISVRLDASDFVEGGVSIEESPKMASMLETAGSSIIDISSGCHETHHLSNDIMRLEECFKLPLWSAIKKAVSIPTIAGGGNRNPDSCEKVIDDGNADFIGLGRALIADPQWPKKAKDGRVEDIRRCYSCGLCLYGAGGVLRIPQACSVNAAYTREGTWSEIKPASVKKQVMIVGGGVAGLEVARVASLRGHKVTIFEKEQELGGQLLLAATPPGKQKMLWLRDYLITQLDKQGVEVKLGVEVTPAMIDKGKPEALVIATGARPLVPDLPGINDTRVANVWDILKGNVETHNKEVVVIGGGEVGCEAAEFLAQKGNAVTVVEMLPIVASDMEPTNRRGLLDSLEDHKVKLHTDLEVKEITRDSVEAVTEGGKRESIKAEAVVYAQGSQPVRELVDSFEDKGVEFHAIGDCQEPRKALEAIYEGSLVGRQI